MKPPTCPPGSPYLQLLLGSPPAHVTCYPLFHLLRPWPYSVCPVTAIPEDGRVGTLKFVARLLA